MLTPFPDVDGNESLEQPFDFSKFPNLQEVELEVGWMSGRLLWIPRALSTIDPATSPRLSVIKLDLARPPNAIQSVNALIEVAGDDLRWVADEIARIEGGFEGAVNPTVLRDPSFQVVFDTLNVRFSL